MTIARASRRAGVSKPSVKVSETARTAASRSGDSASSCASRRAAPSSGIRAPIERASASACSRDVFRGARSPEASCRSAWPMSSGDEVERVVRAGDANRLGDGLERLRHAAGERERLGPQREDLRPEDRWRAEVRVERDALLGQRESLVGVAQRRDRHALDDQADRPPDRVFVLGRDPDDPLRLLAGRTPSGRSTGRASPRGRPRRRASTGGRAARPARSTPPIAAGRCPGSRSSRGRAPRPSARRRPGSARPAGALDRAARGRTARSRGRSARCPPRCRP